MDDVRNEKLIVSIESNVNGRTITIKDATKLSEVFNHLPSGIVIKDETGMGATYLELTAARPSIIVEPLKYTASSKAQRHDAIYYGSKTSRDQKPTGDQLKERLLSLPKEKQKIVVVADSLKKLRDILKDDIKNYFLLIDEADSFQLDSTFRSSMGKCLDIYKDHPANKRALLTATPLAFSDEKLQGEVTTIIKYLTPRLRTIDLIHCVNINGTAIESITNILQKHPDQKILVAYNSLAGCVEIADYLVSNEHLSKVDISILCSTSSKSKAKAGDFFRELESDVLPSRLSLVTSAYFTGFDLNDDYHLISISDSKNPIFLLSDNRLKQISGRCRQTLLSEAVIYSTSGTTSNIPTKEQMIHAANVEIKALDCISSNYKDTPLLETNLSKIREYIIEHTEDNGAQFLREDINGNLTVNYLSIDASLEGYRVKKNLYQYREQLFNALRGPGHDVTLISKDSNIIIAKSETNKAERKEQVSEIIDRLLNADPIRLKEELHTDNDMPQLERTMIDAYLEYLPYIEKDGIVKILKSLEIRDNKQFRRLMHSVFFFTLPNSENFKSRVLQLFTKGASYTREELFEVWNHIFADTGMGLNDKTFLLSNVVKFTNIHFSTTKDRTTKGSVLNIKITGVNPDGFVLIKHKPPTKDKAKFNNYYS